MISTLSVFSTTRVDLIVNWTGVQFSFGESSGIINPLLKLDLELLARRVANSTSGLDRLFVEVGGLRAENFCLDDMRSTTVML